MSQSLSQVYIHAVYTTKLRKPLISLEIEKELHRYMSGIFKKLESPIIRINSMPDHIHILYKQSRKHSIANIMEITKKESSKFMKTKGVNQFQWQRGYGVFSVSQRNLETVIKYIEQQKQYHQKKDTISEIQNFMYVNEVREFSNEHFWK